MGSPMRAPRCASGYTVAEYYGMVDEGVLGGDDHVELLEGVIVAGEPQNPPHASGVSRVQRALDRAVGDRAIVRVQLDYVAGRRSVPEPDVAMVPPDPDWYATAHPTRAYAVFEVADSSLTQDRLTKAPIYAKNGVPQYVLINLREDCVENYTAPSAPRRRYLERTVLHRGDAVALLAFPDVTIAVDDLLPPRRRARRGWPGSDIGLDAGAASSVGEHHLEEAVVGVLAGEGLSDDAVAEGVAVVALDGELLEHRPGHRDVGERGERAVAVGGAAGVSEERVAGRAASRVPEVVSLGEPQPVDVAPDQHAIVRSQHELEEGVAQVHHVEEGQPGVRPRRRDQLEERPVLAVIGVVVARRAVVARLQPR